MSDLSYDPMKIIVRPFRQWNIVRPRRLFFKFLCCLLICSLAVDRTIAQDIPLVNPSLEDKPKDNKAPAGWLIAGQTPDVQPGMYKVDLPPSEGRSYVGLHSGPGYLEGIAQELATEMIGGRSYNLSFDLAYYAAYVYKGCYGNISIYGGNTPTEKAELLWNSGEFFHTNWQRYSANINPSQNYKYLLVFATVSSLKCDSKYGVVALMDNLSTELRQVPQISIAATTTCPGGNTGNISVKVISGTGPFTYKWLPGGDTTSNLSHLTAGEYKVTVTAKNGLKISGKIEVQESDLSSSFTVTGSSCNGDEENRLSIQTTGGQPPYRYYLNGSDHGVDTPVFEHLPPGNYNVRVEDEMGCLNMLDAIAITEPPKLFLQRITTKNTSCSNVQDGQIILTPSGGTPPYLYSIPAKHIVQSDSILKRLEEGRYSLTVSDSQGCVVEGDALIEKELRDCAVYIPTAFSPNGDGVNDVFRVKVNDAVTEFRLAVYGRWGNLIFETHGQDEGWNGAQKGINLPTGSYLWMVTYINSKEQPVKQQGTLVLIR